MSNFGVFSHQERYSQTLDTINSIRKHAPNSSITLVEMSVNQLDQYKDLIIDQVDEYIDYTNNETVKKIPIKWTNQHVAKSLTETYVLGDLFETWTTRQSRVYKLSGRYCLTDKFVISEQLAKPDQFVFKDMWVNNWPDGWCDIPFQYPTYGYSFPSDQIIFMSDVFKKSHDLVLEHVNSGQYCDIEHAMYNFIPKEKVKLINKKSVEGLIAQNGQNN